jgi:hypothetical protein
MFFSFLLSMYKGDEKYIFFFCCVDEFCVFQGEKQTSAVSLDRILVLLLLSLRCFEEN